MANNDELKPKDIEIDNIELEGELKLNGTIKESNDVTVTSSFPKNEEIDNTPTNITSDNNAESSDNSIDKDTQDTVSTPSDNEEVINNNVDKPSEDNDVRGSRVPKHNNTYNSNSSYNNLPTEDGDELNKDKSNDKSYRSNANNANSKNISRSNNQGGKPSTSRSNLGGGSSRASQIKNAARNKGVGSKPNMPKPLGIKKPGLPSGSQLKDGAKTAAKDGAKEAGKTAAKAMANGAKAVGKGIAAGIKALIAAGPVGWIILAVILVVIVLVVVFIAFYSTILPGAGNDYRTDNNFSERDKKTLEKLNNIVSNDGNRPNAELALYAVAYPYFGTLQDGEVGLYINNDIEMNEEESGWFAKWKKEKKDEILDSFGCEDFCQDLLGETGTERIIKSYAIEYAKEEIKSIFPWNKKDDDEESDESDDEKVTKILSASDDPYLKIFRKRKYKSKFKKLLKKLNTEAEVGDYSLETQKEFYDELEKQMEKDAGYKSLLAGTKNKEALIEAIKKDIAQNADMFSVYIGNNCENSYTFASAGQISFDITKNDISLQDLLSKNILVDVKDKSCGTGKLDNCPSLYQSPIDMEKYIIGVTIQEVGYNLNVEKYAAAMIAEKGFAVGRAYSRGNVSKLDDNTYVIGIKSGTSDQAYCDYETLQFCSSGISKLSDKQLSTMKEAWEKSKNVYLWNGKGVIGQYCKNKSYASACMCQDATCMFQDEVINGYNNNTYEEILKSQYYSKTVSLLTVEEGGFSESLGTVSYNCALSNTNSCGVEDSDFKFYYQYNYKDYAFCGANSFVKSCNSGSNSICSSGCGVTSYAMLVANMSGDKSFTPVNASAEAAANGGCAVGQGSNDGLFTSTLVNKHAGFTAETVPVSDVGIQKIKEVLSQGGMVAANVQSNSPFTTGGHWIVLRAITDNDEVKVADPANADRSTKETYKLEDFVKKDWLKNSAGGMHSWIAIKGPSSGNLKCDNPSDTYVGDGVVTGYLKSPLGPNMTAAQTKRHANCSGLYYCGNWKKYHGAIDFGRGVSAGDPIYAMDGGKVVRSGWGGSYGNYVVIEHKTTNGSTYYTLYAHMSKILSNIKINTQVSQGQQIGKLGNTGNSFGAHLHAELLKSISCLGHTCRGNHYNILKYIGVNKTYVGQRCDGIGC